MRYLSALLLALFLTTGSAFAEAPAPDAATPAAAATVADDDDSAKIVAGTPVVEEAAEATAADDDDSAKVGADIDKVPETDEEVGKLIGMLLDAANNGHWTVFVGLLLMLVIFVLNRIGLAAKVGPKWVPWVTLGVGAAASIGLGLATGVGIGESITLGLLEGGIAIALWELVAKHVTSKKADGTPREA